MRKCGDQYMAQSQPIHLHVISNEIHYMSVYSACFLLCPVYSSKECFEAIEAIPELRTS